MSKKVAFLDWDGVINPFDHPIDPTIAPQIWTPDEMTKRGISFFANQVNLDRYLKLEQESGCKCVFTSTWRIGSEGRWFSVKYDVIDNFKIKGLIDRTPYMPAASRLQEIQAWLKKHPSCKNFIIIDDNYDFGELEGRTVHTNHALGLTDSDVEKAMLLFSDPDLRILNIR